MRGRLMFLAGAAAGYVLGARAGRGRYEQIKSQADTLWHDPRVQEKVGQAQTFVADTASSAGSAVVDAAKEKAPDVQAKLGDVADAAKAKVADLTSKDGGTSGPAYGGGTGAAANNAASGVGTGAPTSKDDLQIGSEPGSDYTPHDTKFNSAEGQ